MIVLQGHRDRVESVGFSPDGAAVFAPTWQGVQVVVLSNSSNRHELYHSHQIDSPFLR